MISLNSEFIFIRIRLYISKAKGFHFSISEQVLRFVKWVLKYAIWLQQHPILVIFINFPRSSSCVLSWKDYFNVDKVWHTNEDCKTKIHIWKWWFVLLIKHDIQSMNEWMNKSGLEKLQHFEMCGGGGWLFVVS